jgi:tRNA (uracil-5-)-methyltransferase
MGALLSRGRLPLPFGETNWTVGRKRNVDAVRKLEAGSEEIFCSPDDALQTAPRKKQRIDPTPAATEGRAGSTPVKEPGPPAAVSRFDTTPDGLTHRYKVRCPALHWGKKKDVARVLARVPDFPPYSALQKISTWDHFFISFPNEVVAADGTAKLSNFVFKGDTWNAIKVADVSAKRARINEAIKRASNLSGDANPVVNRSAADATAPWRLLSYEEQIKRKQEAMSSALSTVTQHMWKERFSAGVVPWLDALRSGTRPRGNIPACCPLREMVCVTGGAKMGKEYYRNKNEFTVGLSPAGEPTVGFSLGLVRDGEFCVGAVTEECVTTGAIARKVAEVMTRLVRQSGRSPYDKRAHDGYWRQIMCRHSERTKMLVVIPMVCSIPQACDQASNCNAAAWSDEDCRNRVASELEALCHTEGYRWGLFWQVNDHVSAPAADVPMQWVKGIDRMDELMMGLTFSIHPSAFFQVNTVMAEKLYAVIGELGGVSPSTVVLDICCGTGTIGLFLARQVHLVVGVEMCEPAIVDARANASRNSIANTIYISGKVEDKIRDVLSHVPKSRECIAILDPPRAGLHNNVSIRSLNPSMSKFCCLSIESCITNLQHIFDILLCSNGQVMIALRAAKAISRIIYVACEPKNIWKNTTALCRPPSKTYVGLPFRPVQAVGVDLFPHTGCGELVLALER